MMLHRSLRGPMRVPRKRCNQSCKVQKTIFTPCLVTLTEQGANYVQVAHEADSFHEWSATSTKALVCRPAHSENSYYQAGSAKKIFSPNTRYSQKCAFNIVQGAIQAKINVVLGPLVGKSCEGSNCQNSPNDRTSTRR